MTRLKEAGVIHRLDSSGQDLGDQNEDFEFNAYRKRKPVSLYKINAVL